MSIPFRCVECSSAYDVDDELAGKPIRCRACSGRGKVPSSSISLNNPTPTVSHSPKVESMSESATQEGAAAPERSDKQVGLTEKVRKNVWAALVVTGVVAGIMGAVFGAGVLSLCIFGFRSSDTRSGRSDQPASVKTPVIAVANVKKQNLAYEALRVGMTRREARTVLNAIEARPTRFLTADAWNNNSPPRAGEVKWTTMILLETYEYSAGRVCALYRYRPVQPVMALRNIEDDEWVLEDKTDNDYFPATDKHISVRYILNFPNDTFKFND